MIWSEKPKDLFKPFFSLKKENTGQGFEEKILKVKNILLKNKIDHLLVTAPDNVAWILNIRGYDSPFSPLPNARLLIDKKGNIDFFCSSGKAKKIKNKFYKKVKFYEENKLEERLKKLDRNNIWLDNFSCSLYYKNLLKRKNKIILIMHSTCFFKSLEIFIILSNSSSDSTLIENIPVLMASLISSFVLPTPEKTIF